MIGTLLLLLFSLTVLSGASSARANGTRPEMLRDVGFDQTLNARLPLDLLFRDENKKSIRLEEYFGEKPLILVLAYYECPNLCPLVLDGLVRSLKALSFDVGNQFDVIAVSIDPGEGPAVAAAEKRKYLQRYGRPGAGGGWHFLTGDKDSIEQLARAVGFRFTYDSKKDQYAHATGVVILTPQGRISRYLYGIEYAPRDLRLALVEASANKIGSPVDQLLLFCYQYDPATGKYSLVIMNVLRMAGLGTAVGLGAFVFVMIRRERVTKKDSRKKEKADD